MDNGSGRVIRTSTDFLGYCMSNLKLVIGNKNYSTWSLRPWFFLKNLNIDFEEELVFILQDDTDEYLKPYNSNGKVPILIDINNGFQVWDSLAIIETIADKFPEKQGWPKEATARAFARTVSAEIHSSFFALRDALPMNLRKHFADYPITGDVQLDIDRLTLLWEYCRQYKNNNGTWLFGDFSGADAMFAPVVMRLLGYDVKLTGFAAEYVDFVYNNEYMQKWIDESKNETQIIEEDEV